MPEKFQFCRICGRQYPPSQLSNRGICGDCGKQLLLDAIKQLQIKDGPIYKRWRRHYIASMQATIFKLEKEL